MANSTINEFAEAFVRLFYEGKADTSPTRSISTLSLDEAYLVQDSAIQLRTERGEKVIGYKVGCTSRAIRQQFGLQEPIHGRLLEPHVHADGSELLCDAFTDCALEPEFVLCLGRDIRDAELADSDLIKAIDYVSAGIEVHNYRFWFGKPSSQELIASNGIHACVVVGVDKIKATAVDFLGADVSLFVNDQLMAMGPGSEIMNGGGPMASVRWLAGSLIRRGTYLRAGQLIIPGSPVRLISVGPGSVARASLAGVGIARAVFS